MSVDFYLLLADFRIKVELEQSYSISLWIHLSSIYLIILYRFSKDMQTQLHIRFVQHCLNIVLLKQRPHSSLRGFLYQWSVLTGHCCMIIWKGWSHLNTHTLWLCGHHSPGIPFFCCNKKKCHLGVGVSWYSQSLAICRPVTTDNRQCYSPYLMICLPSFVRSSSLDHLTALMTHLVTQSNQIIYRSLSFDISVPSFLESEQVFNFCRPFLSCVHGFRLGVVDAVHGGEWWWCHWSCPDQQTVKMYKKC